MLAATSAQQEPHLAGPSKLARVEVIEPLVPSQLALKEPMKKPNHAASHSQTRITPPAL